MLKYNGQTGSVLKIQLTSALISARWGLASIAMGGKIPIEIETQFVADGSSLKLSIKDLEGHEIEAIEGKTYNNYHRSLFALTKPNKTGGMYFEVELSAHKLKGVSPKIRVQPPINMNDLKWLDDKGQMITEVTDGQLVELTAKVQGATNGTEGYIEIKCRKSESSATRAALFSTPIKEGKISIQWKVNLPGKPMDIAVQHDLDKLGLEYYQPKFFFEASCLGVTEESKDVTLASWVQFDFNGQKGKAILLMPDGTEETKDVPADGILRFEKPKVGAAHVIDFIPDGKIAPETKV